MKSMRTNIIILFTLFIKLTSAQTVFTVDSFAADYYGKVEIDDTAQVFSKGWVAIYERKTNKEIIKVVSDELALSLHHGKVIANIAELPYGEQSLIMYDDFNFDGKKDFAIEDGQNSCYHGPVRLKFIWQLTTGFHLANRLHSWHKSTVVCLM